jgi:hypothetical protein
VSYYGADSTGAYVGLKASSDEGATFGPLVVASDAANEEYADFATCVTDGTSEWIAYGTSTIPAGSPDAQPQLDAVRLAVTKDGGKTFTRSIVAAKGPTYMHPRFVRHTGGTLDVVYYQGAHDGDPAGSLRRARVGTDGVATASEAVGTPLTFTLSRASEAWLGDYVGVLDRNGALLTTYADNASGLSHIAFRNAGK